MADSDPKLAPHNVESAGFKLVEVLKDSMM